MLTKRFLKGRTEAMRTVTPEVVAFVEAFADPAAGHMARAAALRAAAKRHVAGVKACAKGHGVDRHLFALKCMWEQRRNKDVWLVGDGDAGSATDGGGGASAAEKKAAAPPRTDTERRRFSSIGTMHAPAPAAEGGRRSRSNSSASSATGGDTDAEGNAESGPLAELPAIFDSPGWKTLNHTVISTSNCGNPSLRFFGFGPVVADGFGIGYIIKDGGIQYCATSHHRQTARFLVVLAQYLAEARVVLEAAAAEAEALQRRIARQAQAFDATSPAAAGRGGGGGGGGFFDVGAAPAVDGAPLETSDPRDPRVVRVSPRGTPEVVGRRLDGGGED